MDIFLFLQEKFCRTKRLKKYFEIGILKLTIFGHLKIYLENRIKREISGKITTNYYSKR